jgi:hypothetical protein
MTAAPSPAVRAAALQAHSHPIHAMKWTHDGLFLISGDRKGIVHYQKKNLRTLEEYALHEEPIRELRLAAVPLAGGGAGAWVWAWGRLRCRHTLPVVSDVGHARLCACLCGDVSALWRAFPHPPYSPPPSPVSPPRT